MPEEKHIPKRSGKLEGMNVLFTEALKKMKIGKEFSNQMVLFYWPQIAGKDIANHVFPVKLEFRCLYLRASHPAWAEQIKFMEKDIVTKINNYMGEYLVSKISFTNMKKAVTGNVNLDDERNFSKPLDMKKELGKIDLSSQEDERVVASCSVIKDEALREQFISLGRHVSKYNKYKKKAGWQKCCTDGCSTMCEPGEKYCGSCQRKNKQEKARKIQEFLYNMPWASYADIRKYIECDVYDYNDQRTKLLQKLVSSVYEDDYDSIEAKTMVMLYFYLPPEQLTRDKMEKAMKKLRFDLLQKDKSNMEKNGKSNIYHQKTGSN